MDLKLLKQAESCGCIVYWAFDHAWYDVTVDGHKATHGPYRSLNEAAIAALCNEGN